MDVSQTQERGFVLRGVRWATYVELDRARGRNHSQPKLAYLDGALEVVVTSREHELRKTLLARFIEAFAEERGIELGGFGSTTFQDRAAEAGLEPDECYFLGGTGMPRGTPDLAIEIAWSRTGIDKLEIYRRLGVREVWLWEDDAIQVHRLFRGAYHRRPESIVVRNLDLDDLARRVVATNPRGQTAAVRTYRAWLRR